MKAVATMMLALLLADAAQAGGFVLATWNIQTLTTPNERVFPNQRSDQLRKESDMGDLRAVRDAVGADVVMLEEISSPKALAQVFPAADWHICLSGQFTADTRGLGPDYPSDKLADIRPLCFSAAGADLPDPPPGELRKQYVAVAVRKASGVSIQSIADVPDISVPFDDKDDTGAVVVRNVRWGLEVVVAKGDKTLRILGVHLKTGCFTGPLFRDLWDGPPFQFQHDDHADNPCKTLARQMRPLRTWIARAAQQGTPFVIVGDFNRQIDADANHAAEPDLFPVLTGTATETTTDDVMLARVPEGSVSIRGCWPEDDSSDQKNAIDYLIFGPGARPTDWEATYKKLRFVDLPSIGGASLTKRDNDWRLSDHCPVRVSINWN